MPRVCWARQEQTIGPWTTRIRHQSYLTNRWRHTLPGLTPTRYCNSSTPMTGTSPSTFSMPGRKTRCSCGKRRKRSPCSILRLLNRSKMANYRLISILSSRGRIFWLVKCRYQTICTPPRNINSASCPRKPWWTLFRSRNLKNSWDLALILSITSSKDPSTPPEIWLVSSRKACANQNQTNYNLLMMPARDRSRHPR